MIFLPLRGNVYLMPTPRADNLKSHHKFVLLNNPTKDNKFQVLMVNFSTVYQEGRYDTSCILYPEDHPEVKQKSFMVYEEAMIKTYTEIKSEHKKQYKGEMKDDVMERIIKGLIKSEDTTPRVKKFYDQYIK